MLSRDELKRNAAAAIDSHGDEIVRVAKTVEGHPETGFREVKTSALVSEKLRGWGVPVQNGIAITGLKGHLNGGAPGPTVAVLGELDSLMVPGHPSADLQTGAAHACAHHTQIGMVLGVVAGLQATGVLPALSGRVALMAVPAEEYIEVEFREQLRSEGRLEFLGGKPEFIRLGQFDDVDLAMMTHSTNTGDHRKLLLGGTNNGVLAKQVQFIGKAAHAGGAPWQGINALNAATIALTAINALRETFRDGDTVRVHPIITRGGASVNSVPADVRLETFVRARTVPVMMETAERVDRCFRAGALATGARVKITTLPGYLPLINDPHLADLYRRNAEELVGKDAVGHIRHRGSSTDMGDVSNLIPAIQPYAAGAEGSAHGADYVIQDWDVAVLTAAKAMTWCVIDLLAEGAALAYEVKAKHRPKMTKPEYLATMRGLRQEQTYAE
ncbi:MAG: amidohydrolase [Dehalococcoidia bacterium]|nr:amidohydrolase [Dehalococcoidia bacterium]